MSSKPFLWPGCLLAASVGMWLVAFSLPASAEPLLQIYIEGAEYDETTESWYLAPPGSSAGAPFRLWAIGNLSQYDEIRDVKLAFAYSAEYRTDTDDLQFTLTPSTTGGYGGFSDPSTAGPATLVQYGEEGTVPLLGDGSPLPAHGQYGDGIVWQEFLLGNLDIAPPDSPLGDFVGSFPTDMKADSAQINVYEVSVMFQSGTTAHGVPVHIDLYNHVQAGNSGKYNSVFAPFSHDADGDVDITPEPGTWAALLGIAGFGGLGFVRGYRRRKKAA